MNPFQYQRPADSAAALVQISMPGSKFLGGGTNLVDLMKYNVEHPTTLIDVSRFAGALVATKAGGAFIPASMRNSDLANHTIIRQNYPMLTHALLSGASPQLRNMATTGGNLLQRTRCYYFMDTAFPACNKRNPGSGCAAIKGYNRIHAILGASDQCIATNPSDMNVALAALDATVEVQSPRAKRSIPFANFHRLPGSNPQVDTNLRPDELIVGVTLPPSKFAKNSWYLKVRDRQSYAFALVSVAAGLEMDGGTIKSAGLALGGVAHKPWRSLEAERSLAGQEPTEQNFWRAANLAVAGARPYLHNAFKIDLAKQNIVRALALAARGDNA